MKSEQLVPVLGEIVKHLPGQHDQTAHAGEDRKSPSSDFIESIDVSSVLQDVRDWSLGNQLTEDKKRRIAKYYTDLLDTYQPGTDFNQYMTINERIDKLKKTIGEQYFKIDSSTEQKHLAGKHDQKEHGKTAMAAMQNAPKNIFEARKMKDAVVKELSNMSKVKLPKELKQKILNAAKQLSAKGSVNTLPQMKPLMANAYRLMQEANKYIETGGKSVKKPIHNQPKPSAPASTNNRPKVTQQPKMNKLQVLKNYNLRKFRYNQAAKLYKAGKVSENYLKINKDSFNRAAQALREVRRQKSMARY